ncbi:MAG: hypothetical protein WBC91_23010 [Phototrophicaceae bacterium]
MKTELNGTIVLRIATSLIGLLLLFQGEFMMALFMFLLIGGIEWHGNSKNSETNDGEL